MTKENFRGLSTSFSWSDYVSSHCCTEMLCPIAWKKNQGKSPLATKFESVCTKFPIFPIKQWLIQPSMGKYSFQKAIQEAKVRENMQPQDSSLGRNINGGDSERPLPQPPLSVTTWSRRTATLGSRSCQQRLLRLEAVRPLCYAEVFWVPPAANKRRRTDT